MTWDNVHAGVALMMATRLAPGEGQAQSDMQWALDSWVYGREGITITPEVCCRAQIDTMSAVDDHN